MAIQTLTEANKYSTTKLQKMFIDRLAKDNMVFMSIPYQSILGNSLTYNTWTTRSTAAFYSPGDTWTESTGVLSQATATLTILGGDADVDNFLKATRSDQIDLKAQVLDERAKAIRETFMDTFWYGSTTSNPKQFNGLQGLISSTTYNTVHAGSSTGSALSMLKLNEAIDLIRGEKPDMIVMTRQMRRYIGVYLNSIGSAFPREMSKWGVPVDTYAGIPVIVDDNLLNTETASSGAYAAATGGANTSIFILKFGPTQVCGLQGPTGVEVIPLGDLETKDADRTRIRWYCGMMFQDLRSCAKVDGVIAAGTVTS